MPALDPVVIDSWSDVAFVYFILFFMEMAGFAIGYLFAKARPESEDANG